MELRTCKAIIKKRQGTHGFALIHKPTGTHAHTDTHTCIHACKHAATWKEVAGPRNETWFELFVEHEATASRSFCYETPWIPTELKISFTHD